MKTIKQTTESADATRRVTAFERAQRHCKTCATVSTDPIEQATYLEIINMIDNRLKSLRGKQVAQNRA